MNPVESNSFELERRGYFWHQYSTLDDETTPLNYDDDPNNITNGASPGETKLYSLPIGNTFFQSNGKWWQKKSAPNTWQEIGSGGSIINISDLADVDDTGITNDQVLVFNSGSGLYIPGNTSNAGLVQNNVDIPNNTTETVDSVILTNTQSVKWIITAKDNITNENYSAEIFVNNNNSVLETVKYAIMGNLQNIIVDSRILNSNIILEITNNSLNLFKTSNIRTQIITY